MERSTVEECWNSQTVQDAVRQKLVFVHAKTLQMQLVPDFNVLDATSLGTLPNAPPEASSKPVIAKVMKVALMPRDRASSSHRHLASTREPEGSLGLFAQAQRQHH